MRKFYLYKFIDISRLLKVICDVVSNVHGIPPLDILEIRKKAGNIIPSIISTTAVVAGFMLLNILQIPIENPNFVNMAYSQVRP